MPPIDRRSLLLASASAPFVMAAAGSAKAAEPVPAKVAPPSDGKGVTRTLARYVTQAKYDDLPEKVRQEGVRTLMNWVASRNGRYRGPGADAVFRAGAGQPVRSARAVRHHERRVPERRRQPYLRL